MCASGDVGVLLLAPFYFMKNVGSKWYLTCLLDVKAEKTQSKINSLRLSALETDKPRTEPSLSACFDCHWVLGLAWPRENSQFALYSPVIIS